MATYNIAPAEDSRIVSIIALSKTIAGEEKYLNINSVYDTASWTGELSTAEVDAINDDNDAWSVGVVGHADGPRDADDFYATHDEADQPTGFVPADYSSLVAELGSATLVGIKGDVDDEAISAIEDTYESLGLAGLETAGWTATEEEIRVHGVVTLTLDD